MSDENVVEELVVRITGDGANFIKMLFDAVEHTNHAAHSIENAAHHIEGFQSSLEHLAHTAEQAFAAIGIGFELKEIFEASSKAESNMIRLGAAIRANGEEVGETVKEYKEFALELSEVSLQGKDEILQLLKTAETYGLTGKAAEKAARDAIYVAEATEGSAEGIIRITQAVEQGHIKQAMEMSRMVRQLRGAANETEFLAKYQRLLAQGLQVTGDLVNSTEGRMVHLEHAIHELHKGLGAFVVEAITPAIGWMKKAVESLNSMSEETKRVTTWVIMAVGGFLTFISTLSLFRALLSAVITPTNLYIAGLALLAIGFYELGQYIKNARKDVQEFNNTLREGNRLQIELLERRRADTRGIMESASSIHIGSERKGFLEEQLSRAQLELQGTTAGVKAAQEEVARLSTLWNHVLEPSIIEQAKAELANLEGEAGVTRDRIAEIRRALAGMSDEATISSIAKVADKLKEQVATFGMSEWQVERYKLSLAGATAAHLEEVDALGQEIDRMKHHKELMDEGIELTKHINEEGDKQKHLGDLLVAGAISWDTYQKALASVNKEMRDMAGISQALFGSAEARSRIEAFTDSLRGLGGTRGIGRPASEGLSPERRAEIAASITPARRTEIARDWEEFSSPDARNRRLAGLVAGGSATLNNAGDPTALLIDIREILNSISRRPGTVLEPARLGGAGG